MKNLTIISLFLFLIASSCKLGPRYFPPCTEIPVEWKASQQAPNTASSCPLWWEIFQDEALNDLEAKALENNFNLSVACQKVVEARALAQLAKSNLFPSINLNPSYTSTGELFKLFLPGVLPAGSQIPSVFRIHQLQDFIPLTMNYELDLWGRLSGNYESATLAAEAQEEDFHTILLTLTSDLANYYFQMRVLDAQIIILLEGIELRKKSFELNQSRQVKGIGNELDVLSASIEITNAESSYYDSIRQRNLLENLIATLIGTPASNFCIPSCPLKILPPMIPAGAPSTILIQRPDIAQAERRSASEHALIGVAYASYFPSISLTSTWGYLSPTSHDFLQWLSRFWSLGASATETVFDGGHNDANLRAAWARFYQASGTYQQQVLIAFQEVEDALNNLEFQKKQYDSLEKATMASKKRTTLSSNRYKKGLSNYLEVIDSERTELNAELNLSTLLGQRYLSTIQLIKALGGSWNCD